MHLMVSKGLNITPYFYFTSNIQHVALVYNKVCVHFMFKCTDRLKVIILPDLFTYLQHVLGMSINEYFLHIYADSAL